MHIFSKTKKLPNPDPELSHGNAPTRKGSYAGRTSKQERKSNRVTLQSHRTAHRNEEGTAHAKTEQELGAERSCNTPPAPARPRIHIHPKRESGAQAAHLPLLTA